jgi:hypothetical protein
VKDEMIRRVKETQTLYFGAKINSFLSYKMDMAYRYMYIGAKIEGFVRKKCRNQAFLEIKEKLSSS